MTKIDEVFIEAEFEVAELLDIDVETAGPVERLRLGRAVALRLEIDRLDGLQRAGQLIDVVERVRAAELLEGMIAESVKAKVDLTGYTDDQLALLERCASLLETGVDLGDTGVLAEANTRTERAMGANNRRGTPRSACAVRFRVHRGRPRGLRA